MRKPWDAYFIEMASLVATRSTCNRKQVGAVIVREKRTIASGYNGSVAGDVHCIDVGCKVVDGHCIRTVHAESNAILQCAKFGVSTRDADLYVTHFPCLQCTKQIIQAGIAKVIYAEEYHIDPYALELFAQANVTLVYLGQLRSTSV
ncbi:MAG: ComE operon protein 2 [Acidibacillus sp.]|uniref:ComE operon protein 2 n=1 Tax=Sulfoacidibacillus ferrooxidans TaxID=2005001 RepID=A0A9X1VAV8_9BACL|nr:ComE operon protein 2 [Sulfoacidibacillus ferrooxidans]MCI0182602.1 tRNA-specific adenosine deaminase [Sulfoacidibacillus ferrooxidans]MCY0894126.1 ComE operon protein 2 [Acidibacillus sp.]